MSSDDALRDFNSYLYVGETLFEKGILQEVEKFLCYQGGKVYRVTSSAEARAIVENNKIAAIIVDQYLHLCSGLDFMRWVQNFASIPTIVIVMNKFSKDTETVVALEAGAADAVHSDISPRELAARVNAATRKYFHGGCELVMSRFGLAATNVSHATKTPLYFTPESKRLYFSDSSRAVLQVKEAELLTLLIYKYPDFMDREDISQGIFHQGWNPNDRRIDNLISRLRKVVDAADHDGSESFVETVRNEGYRLRSPIALVPIENAAPVGTDRDITVIPT